MCYVKVKVQPHGVYFLQNQQLRLSPLVTRHKAMGESEAGRGIMGKEKVSSQSN